jgi:hypothetical protein
MILVDYDRELAVKIEETGDLNLGLILLAGVASYKSPFRNPLTTCHHRFFGKADTLKSGV